MQGFLGLGRKFANFRKRQVFAPAATGDSMHVCAQAAAIVTMHEANIELERLLLHNKNFFMCAAILCRLRSARRLNEAVGPARHYPYSI
jgi:hypothetical protein